MESRRGPPSATSVRPCVPAGYLGACCVHTPGAVRTPHSARTPGYLGACCVHTPGAMRTPHSARTPGYLGAKGGEGTPRPYPQTPLRYQGKYWASLFQYLPESQFAHENWLGQLQLAL